MREGFWLISPRGSSHKILFWGPFWLDGNRKYGILVLRDKYSFIEVTREVLAWIKKPIHPMSERLIN